MSLPVSPVTSPEQVNIAFLEAEATSGSVEHKDLHVDEDKKATATEVPFVHYPLADHSEHIAFLERVITEKPANTRQITNIFYRMHKDSHQPALGCCGAQLGHDDLLRRVNTFQVQKYNLQQRHAKDPRVRISLRHALKLKTVIPLLAKEQLAIAKKADETFKLTLGKTRNK